MFINIIKKNEEVKIELESGSEEKKPVLTKLENEASDTNPDSAIIDNKPIDTKPFEMTLTELESLEWTKGVEDLLADETYEKHLTRQANRILLKLKTLHYIHYDLIGAENALKLDDEETNTLDGIDLLLPDLQNDLPSDWWDKSCDSSMVMGVYIHGYEKYSKIRCDEELCFLKLCGLPNATELLAEQQRQQQEDNNEENGENVKDGENDLDVENGAKSKEASAGASNAFKVFPSSIEFNNRLRKLITAHQKLKKQMEMVNRRNLERQEKRLSKLASTQVILSLNQNII